MLVKLLIDDSHDKQRRRINGKPCRLVRGNLSAKRQVCIIFPRENRDRDIEMFISTINAS